MRNLTIILIIALFIGGLSFFSRSFVNIKNKTVPVTKNKIAQGEELARQHCVECHVFTQPELLPKKSWNFLLTYMGLRLGIDDESYLINPDFNEKNVIDGRRKALSLEKLIPSTPAMSSEDWKLLRNYYATLAPDHLPTQENKPAQEGIADLFKEKKHRYHVDEAITTMIKIDEKTNQLLVGDSRNQTLVILDQDLNYVSRKRSFEHTLWVDAEITNNGAYFLSIGDFAGYYVGGRLGSVVFDKRIGDMYIPQGVVLENLYRPTDIGFSDLNNDGEEEMVVCNFGDEGGDFSIYKRKPDSIEFDYEPIKKLYENTGPIKCAIHDFNSDGLPDLMLMVSDVDEHVSLFINKGNFEFEERVIIQTNPSWGYANFQMIDFNKDGHMDVVTTNGDSPDVDPYNTLKPYHGIRIYLNDGRQNFNEAYFYPMYGCYHVHIHDYDLDGDLDIAASSFYPDFEADEPENFVYLEQIKPMSFIRKTHFSTQKGRWMTMDAGDIDNDGDIDIALGGCYIPVGLPTSQMSKLEQMQKEAPTILFLENKTID